MTDKKPRGGAGRGQGRKPKDPAHLWYRYIIRLPPEWKADLKAEYGTLQKAIETLVIQHHQEIITKGDNAMLTPIGKKFHQTHPAAFIDLGGNVGLVPAPGYQIVTGALHKHEGRFDARLLKDGKLVASYDAATDEVY